MSLNVYPKWKYKIKSPSEGLLETFDETDDVLEYIVGEGWVKAGGSTYAFKKPKTIEDKELYEWANKLKGHALKKVLRFAFVKNNRPGEPIPLDDGLGWFLSKPEKVKKRLLLELSHRYYKSEYDYMYITPEPLFEVKEIWRDRHFAQTKVHYTIMHSDKIVRELDKNCPAFGASSTVYGMIDFREGLDGEERELYFKDYSTEYLENIMHNSGDTIKTVSKCSPTFKTQVEKDFNMWLFCETGKNDISNIICKQPTRDTSGWGSNTKK